MAIKTRFLERKLIENANDQNFVGVMEILSKDKKLAEKYLDTMVNSDVFPEFAKMYVESIAEIIESNNKSSDKLFRLFEDTRADLQSYLNDNVKELSSEERKYVGEQILELVKMAVKLDHDNKNFLLKIAGTIGGALAFIGVAIAAGIANNNESSNYAIDSNEDDEDFIEGDYEDKW